MQQEFSLYARKLAAYGGVRMTFCISLFYFQHAVIFNSVTLSHTIAAKIVFYIFIQHDMILHVASSVEVLLRKQFINNHLQTQFSF